MLVIYSGFLSACPPSLALLKQETLTFLDEELVIFVKTVVLTMVLKQRTCYLMGHFSPVY